MLLEPHRGQPVHVCCSGSFRVDVAIKTKWPERQVFSNDVSLLSCALGGLLTGASLAFQFTGDLEGFEALLEDASPLVRLAVLVVALEACKFSPRHAFGRRMRAYYERHAVELVNKTEARLRERFSGASVDGFAACDFRLHAEHALREGGIVVAFPPTYKAGYERLYRRLDDATVWDRPEYSVWDPKEIEGWIAWLRKAGARHCVFVDHPIDGLTPLAKYTQPRQRPIFLYGALDGRASLRRRQPKMTPFAYRPVDPAALRCDSGAEIARVHGAHFNFLRNRYLAKGIDFVDGLYDYVVRIDGAVAGGFAFARDKYDSDSIYLLSDFSVRRERRLAKLIAMLATGQEAVHECERKLILRIQWVRTTVFTERPVSMKYRGIFELTGRKPGFLNYRSAVRAQPMQAIYEEWFKRYAADDPNHAQAAA